MPLSDSSQTWTRAVRPEPSPAVLRLTFAAGISEVSRFSGMKFLGVPGAFDYAGPKRAGAIAIVRVAFRLSRIFSDGQLISWAGRRELVGCLANLFCRPKTEIGVRVDSMTVKTL